MVLTSNLLKDKGSSTVSFSANENLTNTGASLATGCTCLSVYGGAAAAATDGTDATKVGLTLTTPTSGTKTLKESSTSPIANTQGIYGIVIAGRDSSSQTNVGVGGVVKVTDEDVSKYFTTADDIEAGQGGLVADASLDADSEAIKIKLKHWPLADHDGDGDMRDSITGMTVEGTSVSNIGTTDSLYVSSVDFSEAETVTLTVGDLTGDADALFVGADTIAAGEKVKITYYYVAASNVLEVDLTAPALAASSPFSPEDSGSITDTTPSIR